MDEALRGVGGGGTVNRDERDRPGLCLHAEADRGAGGEKWKEEPMGPEALQIMWHHFPVS